jgi:glycerol-3-phosphate acyltransferase PlsY
MKEGAVTMGQRRLAAGQLAAAGALGYLFGAVPSPDLAVRVAAGGVDLRSTGSGNPGALNAAHALGRRWGVAVLAADMAKGAAAGLAGRALAGDGGAYAGAAASIAGHSVTS